MYYKINKNGIIVDTVKNLDDVDSYTRCFNKKAIDNYLNNNSSVKTCRGYFYCPVEIYNRRKVNEFLKNNGLYSFYKYDKRKIPVKTFAEIDGEYIYFQSINKAAQYFDISSAVLNYHLKKYGIFEYLDAVIKLNDNSINCKTY